MRWQRQDVEIATKFVGETFILTGEDGAECFEGVDSFKYFGMFLHQLDEDWPEVFQNIWRARQVWGWLGNLMRRNGVDPPITAKFYRVVVHAVLLFDRKPGC